MCSAGTGGTGCGIRGERDNGGGGQLDGGRGLGGVETADNPRGVVSARNGRSEDGEGGIGCPRGRRVSGDGKSGGEVGCDILPF
jgi:hypothetical protein